MAGKLDRAFAGEPSAELQDHLERCPRCADSWEQMSRLAELGKALPRGELTESRSRRIRDALLVKAGALDPPMTRTGPRWRRPEVIAVVAAAAALLLVAVWRPWADSTHDAGAPVAYRGTVRPLEGARFSLESPGPDEIVRLHDGTVAVEVEHLGPGERFRVVTGDGEVEVRGTAFEVRAADERLAAVRVQRGRVVVRSSATGEVVTLGPGEHWERRAGGGVTGDDGAPEADATGDDGTPDGNGTSDHGPPVVSAHPPMADSRPTAGDERSARARTNPPAPATPAEVEMNEDAPAPEDSRRSASPAELLYQSGFDALRRGDFGSAAEAFEGVIADEESPLASDATYWRAVALGRSGRDAEAAHGLRAYLHRSPRGARAGEAQAMLGWILLRQGDREGAERAFRAAATSSAPRARESAERGLAALHGADGDDSRPAVER